VKSTVVALALAILVMGLLCAACERIPETAERASPDTDAQLLAEIRSIPAIDNHAHPVRPTSAGESRDKDYDALPVDNLEPQSDPIRLRPTGPEFAEARRVIVRGDPAKVLDQLGISIMLANRVSMGSGLPADRFLWVPYADALMYPLSNDAIIHNSDQKAFFALEQKLLRRYYSESGVAARPATLDEYLSKVVRGTLERHKQGGAVAEKFEMAYLRPFDVGNPSKAEAESAWAGRGPYQALQDYILRYIAAECGRLGMAVHIHSDAGAGGYFNVSGGNPMLLEPLLDDPSLRATNFVFLHGGWPFEHQLTALLAKPNAYVDFSSQNLANYPAELARTIRAWLEYVPEKVLFATDAYPYSAEAGWEETGYIAATTGREALALALTGMLRDSEITRARASELARMVLRDNARALYKLK
jgi:predicted TIM-barrel fold metal-dependent hydrolase